MDGLFGVMTLFFIQQYRQTKSFAALTMLKKAFLIFSVQCVMDFLIPQSSFNAHFSGFVLGMILGIIFLSRSHPIGDVSNHD